MFLFSMFVLTACMLRMFDHVQPMLHDSSTLCAQSVHACSFVFLMISLAHIYIRTEYTPLILHYTHPIQVHNIPEGLAKATVLVAQGVSAKRALWWSVLTCLPQPLVAVPSFLFVDTFRVGQKGEGGWVRVVHTGEMCNVHTLQHAQQLHTTTCTQQPAHNNCTHNNLHTHNP